MTGQWQRVSQGETKKTDKTVSLFVLERGSVRPTYTAEQRQLLYKWYHTLLVKNTPCKNSGPASSDISTDSQTKIKHLRTCAVDSTVVTLEVCILLIAVRHFNNWVIHVKRRHLNYKQVKLQYVNSTRQVRFAGWPLSVLHRIPRLFHTATIAPLYTSRQSFSWCCASSNTNLINISLQREPPRCNLFPAVKRLTSFITPRGLV